MASSKPVDHPRPQVEGEEPPIKQLKLSIDDHQFQLPASLVPPLPEIFTTPLVGESEAFPIVVDSNDGKNRETLIIPDPAQFGIVNTTANYSGELTVIGGESEAYPILVKSLNEDTDKTVGAKVENGSSEEQTRIGEVYVDEDTKTEQLSDLATESQLGESRMAIDTVSNVDIRETLIPEIAAASMDGRGVSTHVLESEDTTIVTGSIANGSSAAGSHVSADTAVPSTAQTAAGPSLPSDLGAGTSAVQRTKTSLCSYFRKKGCRHGVDCRYAHGEEELRPRPDGSWDPTSERAKNLLQKTTSAIANVVVEVPAAAPVKAPTGEETGESGVNPLSKCIVNLPRGWSVDLFKKFLTDHGISYTTAKKRKGMSVAFVGFQTPEDVRKATTILDGKTVSKKQLKVAESRSRSWEKVAAGSLPNVSKDDSAAHDDTAEGIDDAGLNGNASDEEGVGDLELAAISREGPAGQIRNVCDAVTPLAHKTYEEQLSMKRDSITQVLKRLVRNTRKGIPSGGLLPEWILSARDKGGLPCTLEGVLASPIIDGYRNKCEFSIGCSADVDRVVGFQMGSFREGILTVSEPTDCRNVSIIARSYAATFQEFVRQSELPVWNKKNNSGFWRLLIVREGRAARVEEVSDGNISSISEVMLVVQVCPNGVEEQRRTMEYAKMAAFLSHAAHSASPPLPLTALLVQDHVGISNVASADAPLHPLVVSQSEHHAGVANEYIHDHISNLKFRISPTAFFQVNTLAAERLYNLAGDWAGLTADTLLFDVCCGTGTIGLTLAHRVGLVVGIEMNASAVADAQKNAEINNITNCRFVCSKAEDVMDSLLKEYLALANDTDGGLMKGDNDSRPAQLVGTTKTSTIVSDNHEEDITDKEITQVSSSIMETPLLDKRDDADQVKKAQSEPTTAAINELEGRQPKRQFNNIVAIVDPPRVGLHPVVLKTLRLHTQLHRLVYISCNPESLLANAVELCTPLSIDPSAEKGKGRGRPNWRGMSNVGHARQRAKKMPPSDPFKPVKAIAVDLFPHTVHCEMVMLLER